LVRHEIHAELSFQLFQELPQITEQKLVETSITDYHNEVSELRDKLMGYELQLVDQLEVSMAVEDCLFISNSTSCCHAYIVMGVEN
jgi:hypothetical protein